MPLRLRVVLLGTIVLIAAACSKNCDSTVAPSDDSTDIPSSFVLSGSLSATNGGETLAGASIELLGTSTVTNDSGSYSLTVTGISLPSAELMITREGLLPRRLFVSTAFTRTLLLDAIVEGNGFNLEFFRQLARDSLGTAGAQLRPLRRWMVQPRVFLRTVDEAGLPVDQATLDSAEAAIRDSSAAWTGGRFTDVTVERGPDSRENVNGWVTVKWYNPVEAEVCGRAEIGGTRIWLNYLRPTCGCQGSRVAPSVVRHEFGHALGFFHTDSGSDVMHSVASTCNLHPSAREQYHAAIAYSRPVGNMDPDTDPAATIALSAPTLVAP